MTTRTEVRFVSGLDGATKVPAAARAAGLTRRFAVIQETYRPDKVDLYFDEALWRQLALFSATFYSTTVATVALPKTGSEIPLSSFLEALHQSDELDREPPECLYVRSSGRLLLCVETEFWCLVGGPALYHDSYTYSFYSNTDLEGPIRQSLASATHAGQWILSTATVIGDHN